MTAKALLVDGYVDEPACLGVPPYVSPYIRTIAGVLEEHRLSCTYLTIDQLRDDPSLGELIRTAPIVVMVAGTTVPGAYLGGSPATLTDIRQIGHLCRGGRSALCGPVTFGYAGAGGRHAVPLEGTGFSAVLKGPPAEAVDAWVRGEEGPSRQDYTLEDRWGVLGSHVIRQHPSFPHVMCELETARGCARSVTGGCSFCTEPFYGPPVYRGSAGIAGEVAALCSHGALHFRLGRQPDLLAYRSGPGETPRPDPGALGELFSGIRQAAPGLKTLHIDNINPGTIARFEDEAREALAVIVAGHTPGDVAAFGMETADPEVIRANNLKASPDEVFRAIEVVNEVGAHRRDNVPDLLPGLNFVCGLAGETPSTYDRNEEFLARIIAAGLLVRRVNIRQLMPFPGTRAFSDNTLRRHEKRFSRFKTTVRERFDHIMLAKVFPPGTVLKEVITEVEGSPSFGRQMGSYPILVGFPLRMTKKTVCDALVVGYGSRSLTALPCPVPVNSLPVAALGWIPGIGKKKAGLIASKRPFSSRSDLESLTGPLPTDILFSFS